MNILVKRVFRYIFGIFFILLGIIGLFLPILQGILFIIIGLLILAPESARIRRLIAKLKDRYPHIFEQSHRITTKLKFWKKPHQANTPNDESHM